MTAARYDFLVIHEDRTGELPHFMRNASRQQVQDWIDEYLLPEQLIEVRQISVDEFARVVTDQFFPARDPDASRLAFHRSGIAA